MMAATRRMSGSSARIDTPRHQNLAIAHRAEVATSLRPTGKLQHLIVPQRKSADDLQAAWLHCVWSVCPR